MSAPTLAFNMPMSLGGTDAATVERAADVGAGAVELFDWESADVDAVGAAADERGVDLAATVSAGAGSNVGDPDTDAITDPDCADRAVADVERSLAAAADFGFPNLIVTVGPDQEGLDREIQRETILDVLSRVAPAAEECGVTVVVEPLNVEVDHPGYFLTHSREAYDLVEEVGSPRVKVLFDVYHQQVTEGNVIQRIREGIDRIGHFHLADVPGRHEPGTGELNYENVLRAIADAGYERYVGCEYVPAAETEAAAREAVETAARAWGDA